MYMILDEDTNKIKNKGYLLPQELSKLLGISNSAVYLILKKMDLPVISISSRKTIIPPRSIRKILDNRNFAYQKKILAIHDLKGGVGKTTVAFSLGVRASCYGFKVLLIDLDLQGNLTQHCNIKDGNNLPVWVNITREEAKIEECISNVGEFLDLIPSNLNNSRLEIELTSNNINIKYNIREVLSPVINRYDLIIIDCPPSLCKASALATCASDLVLIPINPDQFSIDGMNMTIDEINRIKKVNKLSVDYMILWNKYDARKKKLPPFFIHKISNEQYEKLISTIIRMDSSFEIAQKERTSVFSLDRKSNAKEDIDGLTKELFDINFTNSI